MKHKKLVIAFCLVFLFSMLSTSLLEKFGIWSYTDFVICLAIVAIWYAGNSYWKTLVNYRYARLLWSLAYLFVFVNCVITSFGKHFLGWKYAIHHFYCLSPIPFLIIYLLTKLSTYHSINNKVE